MKIKTKVRILLVSAITLLSALMVPALTHAAADTCTWTGAVNANWSNGGNWSGCDNGGVPESGDALIFNGGTTSSTNDMVGLSISTLSISATQTISGNTFTIVGGFANSAATATISAGIILGGNQAFASTAGGSIVQSGTLNLNGFNLTTFINGGAMNSTGVISGAGIFTKTGADILILQGNNTFTGNFSLASGAVSIFNSNAFGGTAGTTNVLTGTTINISVGGLTIPENVTIVGSGNVGGGALRNFTGASTWSGTITVAAGGAEINSDAGAGLYLTITGVVDGTGQLNINGLVKFNGNNTVVGPYAPFSTAVVYMNGTNTANYTTNGSTLNGAGSVGVLDASSGTNVVNPGNDAGGVLTVGNTTLNATTTVNTELRSGTSDQLNVAGTVNLASAILATNLDFSAPTGTQFVIVNNDGADAVTGIFAGKAEGAIFNTGGAFARPVQISYIGGTGNNDVVLTVLAIAAVPVVTSNNNPSTAGQSVTLTASFGVLVPAVTGTVSFYDGATLLGASTVNGSGVATLTLSTLGAGSHSITAQYSGDSTYGASTSAVLGQSVTASALASTGSSALPMILVGLVLTGAGLALQPNLFRKMRRVFVRIVK
jgi:autotransporter-associated beta strand protein